MRKAQAKAIAVRAHNTLMLTFGAMAGVTAVVIGILLAR